MEEKDTLKGLYFTTTSTLSLLLLLRGGGEGLILSPSEPQHLAPVLNQSLGLLAPSALDFSAWKIIYVNMA